MAVIHISSEEFADRMEEMFDLADKGDRVLIHHDGKLYTIAPVREDELAKLTDNKK